MKAVRWLANFMLGAIVLVVTLYFVISVCVTLFKLTGQIVEGAPMYFELQKPTWAGLLTFQGVCVAILCVGLYLRSKLQRAS